jgi:Carboxypeptidase regulatory-like domain
MVRLALFLMLAVQHSIAQAPVPIGQAIATVPMMGSVQTPQGELLPNIHVTATSADGQKTFSVQTDAQGQFSFHVPAGQYAVKAAAEGFGETSSNITVHANAAANIKLVLGGPVPVGEPIIKPPPPAPGGTQTDPPGDVPIPAAGAVTVDGQFNASMDLAGWLNNQSARNLRLQSVLATGNYKNLFVWISHPGSDQHVVVPANKIAKAADLQIVVKAYPQATIIGLVWIGHDRYLVLRSNP